jgi:hypothetical protein
MFCVGTQKWVTTPCLSLFYLPESQVDPSYFHLYRSLVDPFLYGSQVYPF